MNAALAHALKNLSIAYGPLAPLPVLVAIARRELNPPALEQFPFLAGLHETSRRETTLPTGLVISVRCVEDVCARLGDDDVTGCFTNRHTDGCVPNTLSATTVPGYQWYRPSNDTLAHTYDRLRQGGMSKSVAADTYRSIVAQEMTDDSNRTFVCVLVNLSLDSEVLADAADLIEECLTHVERDRPQLIARADAHLAALHRLAARPATDTSISPAPTGTGTPATPGPDIGHTSDGLLTQVTLADGNLRIWEPDPTVHDLGRMHVLDVLGVSLMIRERPDGIYVSIERDGDSPPARSGHLIVEVENTGATHYGDDVTD
jgi:hypothetical protein